MLLVIICSLLGGLFSLLGGLILLANQKFRRFVDYLAAFAGGSLLAAAFTDLLSEALHEATNPELIIFATLFGFLLFFLLEIILAHFCGQTCHHHRHHNTLETTDPVVPMLILGDTLHNFVDGIAIAAGFLISPLSGLVVTFAVAAHEIPQEISEFALLLKKNLTQKKIILANLLSSLATTLGAIIFYSLGTTTEIPLAPLLGLTAGFFIYLSASNIIPEINNDKNFSTRVKKTLILILSVFLTSLLINYLHSLAHL